MTRKCVVPGCKSSHHSPEMRFFRFPTFKSSSPLLSKRRFTKWITVLGFRSHYNPVGKFVCGLHFVSGNSARDTDVSNIDWAPSLNVPTSSTENLENINSIESSNSVGDSSSENRTECNKIISDFSDENNMGGSDVGRNNVDSFECFVAGLLKNESDSAQQFHSSLLENADYLSTIFSGKEEAMSTRTDFNSASTSKISSCEYSSSSSATEKEIINDENKCCFSSNDCAMVENYRTELAELQNRVEFLQQQYIKSKRGLEWIENDERSRRYTGINNLKTLKRIFEYVEGSLFKPSCDLTKDQIFVMTLRKLRRDAPFVELADEYSVCTTTISKYFHRTIFVMHACLKYALEPPTKDISIRHLPRLFRAKFGNRRIFIIDCFEVECETPIDPQAANAHHSSYKMKHTAKFLIAMSPHGAVSFISNTFGGRCSDRHIAQASGFLDLLEPGDVVLADKGFNIADLIALRGAMLNIPTFLKKKQQLNPLDMEKDKQITSLRVHIERVIGVLRLKYKYLKGIIEVTSLKRFENNTNVVDLVVQLCCMLINLNYSIM